MELHSTSRSNIATDPRPAASEKLFQSNLWPEVVLLATDGSEAADGASKKAVSISKGIGAELHIIHVWHTVPTAHFRSLVRVELKRRGQEAIGEQTKRIEETGATVAGTYLREGHTADEIVNLAERIGAGLIVVGSRRLGTIGRALVGSVSAEVVRRAPCPVLVVSNEGCPRTPVGEQIAVERGA